MKKAWIPLSPNNLLSQQQHGFWTKRSCLTQLLEYLFDLENALDEGECVDTLYLDCRKAFDTVPHQHLMAKAQSMGIENQFLKWITDFLSECKQRVSVQGCYSSWRDVWSGVSQGSVLGLFLMYIDDLLEGLKSSGKLFADDAKVYRRIRNPNDMTDL